MGEVANRVSGGSFCGGREDIYLFGTMITGILLIGLGFDLGYRKFGRREQLSKVSQGCPFGLKPWEERSAMRLRL